MTRKTDTFASWAAALQRKTIIRPRWMKGYENGGEAAVLGTEMAILDTEMRFQYVKDPFGVQN